jgi:hypothetical protein
VTTAQIYKGSIAFIVLQLIMVSVVVLNPTLVTGNLEKAVVVDEAAVNEMLNNADTGAGEFGAEGDAAADADALGQTPDAEEEVDPLKALEEATKRE